MIKEQFLISNEVNSKAHINFKRPNSDGFTHTESFSISCSSTDISTSMDEVTATNQNKDIRIWHKAIKLGYMYHFMT